MEKIIFWRSQKNFEPKGTSGFRIMAVLMGQNGVILVFFGGPNWNSTFWACLANFFFKSGRNIFLGISKKFWAQRDKRFFNYGHFKGPKWGNFGVFWGSKLKLNILSMFGHLFCKKWKKYFFGDLKKTLSPKGQAVFELWPF